MDIGKFGESSSKSDLLAVVLSSLAGIIQLLLFVLGTLGQTFKMESIFVKPSLIPLLVLLSLIIALCIIGILSYLRKNPDFVPAKPSFKLFILIRRLFFNEEVQNFTFSKKGEKRNLIIMGFLLISSVSVFLLSTMQFIFSKKYFFVDSGNVEFYQTISFVALWVISTVILFIWISNEIEKNYQFKPENFISNLIRSLQSQGYIQITIQKDIQLQNNFHFVKAKIQTEEKFFVVQFDGKRIIDDLDEKTFNDYLNPPQIKS